MAQSSSIPDFRGTNIIMLYVGPKYKQIPIHENRLRTIPYFDILLNKQSKEDSNNIHLQDEDAGALDILAFYLYTGTIKANYTSIKSYPSSSELAEVPPQTISKSWLTLFEKHALCPIQPFPSSGTQRVLSSPTNKFPDSGSCYPFKALSIIAQNEEIGNFQCIAAMDCYSAFCVEELRVADYQCGLKWPKAIGAPKKSGNASQKRAMQKAVEGRIINSKSSNVPVARDKFSDSSVECSRFDREQMIKDADLMRDDAAQSTNTKSPLNSTLLVMTGGKRKNPDQTSIEGQFSLPKRPRFDMLPCSGQTGNASPSFVPTGPRAMTSVYTANKPLSNSPLIVAGSRFPMKPFREFICGDAVKPQPRSVQQVSKNSDHEAAQLSLLHLLEFAERISCPILFNTALLTYLETESTRSQDLSPLKKSRKQPDSHIKIIYSKFAPTSMLRKMVIDMAIKRIADVVEQEFSPTGDSDGSTEEFRRDLGSRLGFEWGMRENGGVESADVVARRYFMSEKK